MVHELTDPGCKPELKWVAIDRINVDRNYQRDLLPVRVRQIVREFDWKKFQPVMLAEQEDGSFNVYDGQHRVEAARRRPDVTEIPAAVIRLQGTREEAEAFVGVNINRTGVTTIERYWAGIEAGDPDMMAVCAVLEDAGCEVVQVAGAVAPNRTNAVTAVSRGIKRYGEDAVVQACRIIRAAWPNEKTALKGTVITALSRLAANNENLSADHMQAVLAPMSHVDLSANAEAMRKISGGTAETNITRVLVAAYNKGKRGNTIELGVK